MSGSEPGVAFRNEMGHSFRLTRLLLMIDEHVLYDREARSDEWALPHFIFLAGVARAPGEHDLKVMARLRGDGEGEYSYLRGYRFEVKSHHLFIVEENRPMRVDVVAWEKGGPTTPFEYRPAIRYMESLPPRAVPSVAPPANSSEVPVAPSAEAPAPERQPTP